MQKKQNNTALVWFRNDLRVQDNNVLNEAIRENKNIMACYCFDPRHFEYTEFGFKKTEKFDCKFPLKTPLSCAYTDAVLRTTAKTIVKYLFIIGRKCK